jgi:hypothetical protein
MVSENKSVSAFTASNDETMKLLDARSTSLDRMEAEILRKEAFELSPQDRKQLAQSRRSISAVRSEIAEERVLREQAKAAIDGSTFPSGTKGKDPAVQQALANLSSHKLASSTAMFGKGGATSCATCDAQIGKVKDCRKPTWQVVTINKTDGTSKTYQGPMYPVCHIQTVSGSSAWNDLIRQGAKTESEKRVISQVAGAEGDFATVQSWDDQIASAGAMQKTIRPDGTGELPNQMADFAINNPSKYKELFVDKGWSVQQVNVGSTKKPKLVNKAFYTPQHLPDQPAQPMTGPDLAQYIKSPDNEQRWRDTLGPLKQAGEDPAFQRQQIVDYNNRLVGALNKKPSGYTKPIGAYVSSEASAGLVLDQDVNRPGNTATDFGTALNDFYAAHPEADKDPAKWGADRAAYEQEITKRYSEKRNMIDSAKRAKDIMESKLGSAPGSFQLPTNPPAPALS